MLNDDAPADTHGLDLRMRRLLLATTETRSVALASRIMRLFSRHPRPQLWLNCSELLAAATLLAIPFAASFAADVNPVLASVEAVPPNDSVAARLNNVLSTSPDVPAF